MCVFADGEKWGGQQLSVLCFWTCLKLFPVVSRVGTVVCALGAGMPCCTGCTVRTKPGLCVLLGQACAAVCVGGVTLCSGSTRMWGGGCVAVKPEATGRQLNACITERGVQT